MNTDLTNTCQDCLAYKGWQPTTTNHNQQTLAHAHQVPVGLINGGTSTPGRRQIIISEIMIRRQVCPKSLVLLIVGELGVLTILRAVALWWSDIAVENHHSQ